MLQLKKGIPAFQVVEGPFKGRIYTHVVNYRPDDIPPSEKSKFIAVKVGPVNPQKAIKEQQQQAEKTA